MTEEEAKYIAEKKARELNMPWGPGVSVKRWRLWPFPGVYRVTCRVPKEFSQSIIDVSAANGKAVPRRVLVSKKFGIGGEG